MSEDINRGTGGFTVINIILLFFQRRVADLPLAATQQSNGTRIGEGIVTAMRMAMARTMTMMTATTTAAAWWGGGG